MKTHDDLGASRRRPSLHSTDINEAQPGDAGRATGAWSAEPMRRPDHKAKKHGRPRSQLE